MPHSWAQWAWWLFFFIPALAVWLRMLWIAPKVFEAIRFVAWAWRKI